LRTATLAACALVLALSASWRISGQAPAPGLGQPLSGITPADFERFRVGLDDFVEVETAEEGLGPAFNGTSCAACHNVPAIGGIGFITEVRAGIRLPDGGFRPVRNADGSDGDTLFHVFSVPNHACQPMIPAEVNVIARRMPIPLFGAGLVEAIPDDAIEARADPEDRDRDGISGRAALVRDLATTERRVGRFGWKAQHATLKAFAGDAYRNEMGITNEIVPTELAVGISVEQMRFCDRIPDPEDVPDPRTGLSAVDNFEAFMKFLAPPPRGIITEEVREGERVFTAIGCSSCHIPAMRTGPSANPLFDRQPVALFSDLLLHDVGTGDGIGQEAAAPNEIRTPALWGLRFRKILLHDGSASSIEEAVTRHGEEAAPSRREFTQLEAAARRAILAFLGSL
jgi:CxxC motif-containing protein (DUF1111 family)